MTECPVPLDPDGFVTLGHGGGGKLTNRLVEELMIPAFGPDPSGEIHDGAVFSRGPGRLAFTTDCHVVDPLFFPGGDIGSLSVIGTVNDLAMCGAAPLWLSAGFILEEGLPMEVLRRVVASMASAAEESGVRIVTGDTKVVNRGRCDGLYICTSGIGEVLPGMDVRPGRVAPGDTVIVSGDIGRHGIAVLARREGISLELPVGSDLSSLASSVAALAESGADPHCMRDLTRGGLAAALNEIASSAARGILVDQASVPVMPGVAGACEILGLDPLQSPCEGRFVLLVGKADTGRALEVLGASATVIGRVSEDDGERGVTLETPLGTRRILEMPGGVLLPRIC